MIYNLTILMVTIFLISCKKDKTDSGLKSVFSYVADGYKVNFTNFSTGASEYNWNFGDNSGVNLTSTVKTPQHIFTAKGDYLVSLTVKNGSESNTFKDTVSILGPNIKIDGDFSDWQYVDYLYENPTTYSSTVSAVKAYASSKDINFYFEGSLGMNMDIIDIYMDADNNPATGFSTYLYPAGSGADVLCEGKPRPSTDAAGFGDIFTHSGAPSAFSWSPVFTFAGAMNISEIKTKANKKIIEFSIKKTALGPIANKVKFALVESTSGYAEIGKIPVPVLPTSKFLTINL